MPTGTATTYDLTEGLYLDFEPMIHMLSPMDVPFQGGYTAEGRLVLPTDTCFEKMVQWHDEELLTPRSTLAATVTTGGTVITVASGDQLNFDVGDLVLINAEYVRVTSLGSTADTLVVTRAVSGSAGTLASGLDAIAVGSLLPEGSDPPDARAVDRNNKYNLTQIFGPHAIKVSGTENVVRKYGTEGTNEFDHQAGNRLKELAIRVEQAIINGVRFNSDTDEWRSMGGIMYYISTINDSSTTTLTEATLIDNLQLAFNNGGSPNVVGCGAKNKRIVSGFTSSGTIQVARADDTAGRVVTYVDTDFGRLTVILNRWFRTQDLACFSRDQATLTTLRPMGFEMLAKTGDSKKGQVLTEKTLRFRKERHAFKMTALT
jgi:hypothetical protein